MALPPPAVPPSLMYNSPPDGGVETSPAKHFEKIVHPTGIEEMVCQDIAKRQRVGIAKYGQTVAENPLPLKAWLQHAYEECLDQAVYLKRAMVEISGRFSDSEISVPPEERQVANAMVAPLSLSPPPKRDL